MRTRRGISFVLIALTLAAIAPPARAADAAQVAADISSSVMSPFCPGLTLHDCPSDAAARLRDRIQSWVEEGRSRSEIMDRLNDEYGPAIAAAPPRQGAGLIVWLLPALVALAGAAIAWRLARRWAGSGHDPPPRPTAEEATILDAELAEMRRRA